MDYFSGLLPTTPEPGKKVRRADESVTTSLFGAGILPDSYYAPSQPAQTERPNAPGLLSDVRRATGQVVAGAGSTLRDLGAEDVGGAVEQYGAGVVQRNPSEIRSFEDVLARPVTTAREAVGEVAPQVGLALGGRLVGGLLGAPLGPAGIATGQFIGGLLPTAVQTYGGVRTEQREKGIDERGRALAVTIPAALLERFGGAERVALRVAGEGTEFLARAAGTGFAKNAAKQFARGGIEEAITELPQTGLERYGVTGETADLTSPEALSEYGVAGAKAFLGGGTVRAGLSSLAGTRQPTVTIQPDGTITSDQPTAGAEGETDLTGGTPASRNVLMTPEQAAQRLQQVQNRRPAALGAEAFEAPPAQRGLFDTRGGEAPPAPVAGEQLDLFGGGGVAPDTTADERQGDLFAPQEPTFQTRITAELLDGLGLPRQSPMYRQLLGKDMADPAQQPQVAALFDRVRSDATISERTKAGVEGLAMQAFGGMAQQQEMFGPRGGAYPQGRPSTQQNAPGPIENLLPTAPLGAAATVAPVEAPAAEVPAPMAQAPAPAPAVTLPTVPAGVTLTADENRLVKQARAVFDIAETDAERASVSAMVQRTIDRAAKRTTNPVSPPGATTAVAASSPAAPVAAGSFPTNVPTEDGTQTTETIQAKAQGQAAPTAAGPAVVVPESNEDTAELAGLIQKANAAKTGAALPAEVEGKGVVRTPGKTSLTTASLRKVRDALLSPEGRVAGGDTKLQALVDAVRGFAKAYSAYEDAGGAATRTPQTESTKKVGGVSVQVQTPLGRMTPAERTAATTAAGRANADRITAAAKTMRDALTTVGTAANGNAKDVEAVVSLVKSVVQKKLHTEGSPKFAKAFATLDTMLSRGWNAAKNNVFQGSTDALYVRQSKVDVSREAKAAAGKAGTQSQLEVAAEGTQAFGRGDAYEGLLGVLTSLRQSGTPMERLLSKAIRESLYNADNAPTLTFIDTGKNRYDPKTNTVFLRRDASPAVVLHEALHAALQRYVYENPKSETVRAMMRSLDRVLEYKGTLTGAAKDVQTLLKDLTAKGNKLDALLELVSYGNTLNEFRTAMQAMELRGAPKSFQDAVSSLWNSLVSAVQRMLGSNRSVASDVITDTLKLLREAETAPAKAARQGNVLEAAIQSADPTTAPTIDAAAQQVGFADATAFANGPGKFKTPTQLVFEIVGLGRVNGKDLPLTASIAKNGAKLANYIRKEMPTLERVIMQFNSNFSNSPATVAAIDNYKFLAQTGHLQMEKIATTIAARPELREPFLDYMDGNTKAFDGIKNASGFKAIADNLKGLMQQYISTLPTNSKERRAFERMPFTQYLISPDSIGQVAGSTLSAGKIASMVGTQKQSHQSLEEFVQFLDMTDGDTVDQDQPLYQMFEEKLGKVIPAGFISKAQYDKTGVTPAGFSVDASRVWKFSKYDTDKGNFEFSSSITTRDALKKLNSEDLALALVNTTAALSHAHAATTYFGNLASIGREGGTPTAEAVAFDSVEEINAVFGDRKLEINNVLQVSDEASKSQALRWQTQRTGTWVQLPKGPTYGALAGKIIPGPVWNAMIDMHDRSPAVNFKSFNELMAFFKQSKTVLNPGTHVTNVLSNAALLILHGIRLGTLNRAARMYANFERNPDAMSPADRALMQAFFNSGAVLGQFTNAELKGSVYDRLSEAITPTSDQSYIKRMTSLAAFEKAKSKLASWRDNAAEIYAAEDNVFRFAAFLETAGNVQLRDGTKQLDAKQLEEVGLAARKMFLDYDIDARAIRAARQTFLPFVSWSYAIMPVLGRMAVTKPWAIVNMMASVMLMQAALGGEDDDELRKQGPDYLRERSLFGLGPYMHMRIPFVGDDQNPTYLNIGKYIPFLSLFQPAPGESPFAGQSWLPGFASPGGPLVTLISAMNGYDPFTGKPMHAPTDTDWDKLVTTGKAAYDTMAPPVVTTKFWDQIGQLKDGAMGPTGVEKSSMFLARTLGGIGLYQFNTEESAFYKSKELKEIKKDYKAAMTKAKREEYRKGYPDYEALDRELDDLQARMQAALAKARGED